MRGLQSAKSTREESQTVTAGSPLRIPEVQNFAKKRPRRTVSDHSQPLLGLNIEMGHNSERKNSSDFDLLRHSFSIFSASRR